MQKIRRIPTSKFVFRERKAQVFILISLMPTSALSCPLRKPNLLVFIHLEFTLHFLYSNFASFKPQLYRIRFIEFQFYLPRSLIRIERNFKVFKFQKFFTISLNITPLNQCKHKRNGSNKIFKLSNPPIFIPLNITPLFSHSHVNYTNRKISRRLYQTPLPFSHSTPSWGRRSSNPVSGGYRKATWRTRSIPCTHTHTHTHTHIRMRARFESHQTPRQPPLTASDGPFNPADMGRCTVTRGMAGEFRHVSHGGSSMGSAAVAGVYNPGQSAVQRGLAAAV